VKIYISSGAFVGNHIKITLSDAQLIANGFSNGTHSIFLRMGTKSYARGDYGGRARGEMRNSRGVAIVRPMELQLDTRQKIKYGDTYLEI